MKNFYLALAVVLSLLIFWINGKLWAAAPDYPDRKEDILAQLNFLEGELKHEELGARMQILFPEGFVFVHALYGLAWSELSLASSLGNEGQERALQEALFAYNALDSEQGRATFQKDLQPAYGVFYAGWKNYLLSKILLAHQSFPGRQKYVSRYQAQCREIEKAMKASASPFLESYSSMAWPADMVLAVASLSNHDKLFPPRYQKTIATWVAETKRRVDPGTQLLPHKVETGTGYPLEAPRGESAALSVRLLAEIDPAFGQAQYELFKTNFVSTALGLPAVRAYPMGTSGTGDVDSGPVILGVGFPATLVSIGVFGVYGDERQSKAQYQTVSAFGLAWHKHQKKNYLAGFLPMADAFIAWSWATNLRVKDPLSLINEMEPPGTWFFHGLSLMVLVILWFPIYRKALFRKLKFNQTQ